jgi:predicted small metal-binding protein
VRGRQGHANILALRWGRQPGQEVRAVKLIRCECGFVARGDSDDQVIGMIRGHMTTDHPALLETVSREDLASWIQVE